MRASQRVGGPSTWLLAILAGLLAGGSITTEARPSAVVRHSVGSPRGGTLEGAVRLPAGPGYYVANAATSYATPTTVAHVQQVLAELHAAHPGIELRVGDLSRREGGRIEAHQSHQSGRDVDLGLVPPPGHGRLRGRFEKVPAERVGLMDERATLLLVRLLGRTREQPGGVQWVLMDYALQERLYQVGVEQGVEAAELEALFQYPHGKQAERGLVRHFPGHRNHMHVRFACAPDDRACRGRAEPPRLGGRVMP